MTFPVGTKRSAILGDFKCDSDGAIYVSMAEDVSDTFNTSALEIVALTPSGDVVRYIPQSIPGYRNIVSRTRYFVSGSYVYMLVTATKIDPMDSRKTIARSNVIQVFDRKGALTQSVFLEPGVDPINLAAFESGEILIVSADRLNQTTRLFLLDSFGRRESELKLFDSDFGKELDLAAKVGDPYYASHDGEELTSLLALAKLIPHGDNLLMGASRTNLPVLELNQHGWIKATKLALPPGVLQEALLPSDDGLLHVSAGNFHAVVPSDKDSQAFFPTEIDTFYPQDGSLFRRVSLASGLLPVCAVKGTYSFLQPREEDGRLQVIRATPAPQ